MDALTHVLKTVAPSGGGFGRRNTQVSWGIKVSKGALAIVHIVVRGECWLALAGDEKPIRLRAGHLVMLTHGHSHTIASDPEALRNADASLRQRQCSLANVDENTASRTTLACGFFNLHGRGNHPLLSVLPPLVHLKKGDAGQWLSTTIKMIAKNADGPGGDALLDQLAGLLFIQAVRAYVESAPSSETGWIAALHDPAIGPVLKSIHENPAENWTVASLAESAGISRTAFAAQFKIVMGEAPMAYVTRWRMHQAAHLLRTEGLTISELCDRVGYRSEATFAKAFKRSIGLPPAAYRRSAMRAPSMDLDAVRAGLLGSSPS